MTAKWQWLLPTVCMLMSACPDDLPAKPDPSKGTVTGIVLCTDTGKPARFAEVQIVRVQRRNANAQGGAADFESDSAITGLDGRFTVDNVAPGDYYAYANLNGYLNLERGIDFKRLGPTASDDDQLIDIMDQWKDHLVTLTVSAQHASDVSIQIERGAEIEGTVTYEDSSPAIDLRFQLVRKSSEGKWVAVGESSGNAWSLEERSDGHGRFKISNLPSGEYKVCALLPVKLEQSAPRICLGGTYRRKNAASVTVTAGESRGGADIVVPLTGMHTISGNIAVGVDGRAPDKATLHLLYADDREEARQASMRKDGSFVFAYVPEDEYILQVTGAQSTSAPTQAASPDSSAPKAQTPAEVHHYLDKGTPLAVLGEMNDVNVSLIEAGEAKPVTQ